MADSAGGAAKNERLLRLSDEILDLTKVIRAAGPEPGEERNVRDGEVNGMLPAPMVRRGFVGGSCGAGPAGRG